MCYIGRECFLPRVSTNYLPVFVCCVIQCTMCRYDQRAADIACQNARSSSAEVKEKVKELIHGWFIMLLNYVLLFWSPWRPSANITGFTIISQ